MPRSRVDQDDDPAAEGHRRGGAELALRLQVPDAELVVARRRRLETRLAKLRKLYSWGDLTDEEYRRETDDKSEQLTTPIWGYPKAEESPVGKVVMYSSVSVDGFVADENDQPGPLFDWLSSGDVPLDESGELKVSQTSYDYTRPYWDQIGATIVGRHVFDMTDGWDGKPPGGVDHVVVVTHRPKPEGWDPEAPFHFVDGVEAAMAKAQELAGDRIVEVAAGDVGGQMLAAGLVDEVRMDVVPVVFGSGKRYFGSVHAQHLLEDPDVVI